jgi:hypothetical protein
MSQSNWWKLAEWFNPFSYFGSSPASPPAAVVRPSALKGATTTIAERLSYVTIIISCHGADMAQTVALPQGQGLTVRKLSLSGKCGVLMWGSTARLPDAEEEPIETIIFDEFSKFRDDWIETHSSGSAERVDHAKMLDEFSLHLKGSGIPQGLQDVFERANKSRPLPRHIAPTLNDWVSYTDASTEHNYSFYGHGDTDQDKADDCKPFGIWLVDSSFSSFSAKDRWSKSKSLEEDMNSKNIYKVVKRRYDERKGANKPKLVITLSELVIILSELYKVKNVNIIDTTCRYVSRAVPFADIPGECIASQCLSPQSLGKLTDAAGQTVSKHNRGGGKICNTTRKNKHRNKYKNKNKNKNKGSLNCRSRAHFITRRQRRSRTTRSRRH